MLAPRDIPSHFTAWNRRWAPHGRRIPRVRGVRRILRLGAERGWPTCLRHLGPFAFQPTNETRVFEFPWAFSQVRPTAGAVVVDVGGSLAGLQFAMAAAGAHVTNVDPGLAATGRGWAVEKQRHAQLCRAFGAGVTLISETLQDAGLPTESVDTVVCVSTIEHIPATEVDLLAPEIYRVLKPGGRAVLTVDLFLDLAPFSDLTQNQWGTNIDVWSFIIKSRLQLIVGEPSLLLGSPSFDPKKVLGLLPELFIGTGYPALAQCIVLEKVRQ